MSLIKDIFLALYSLAALSIVAGEFAVGHKPLGLTVAQAHSTDNPERPKKVPNHKHIEGLTKLGCFSPCIPPLASRTPGSQAADLILETLNYIKTKD